MLQKLQEQLASMQYVPFLCPGDNDPRFISSLSQECQRQDSRSCCASRRAVLAAEDSQLKASSEASREAEEAYSCACQEMQGGGDFLQAQQALQACKAQLLQVCGHLFLCWHRGRWPLWRCFPQQFHFCNPVCLAMLHGDASPRALQHRKEVGGAL